MIWVSKIKSAAELDDLNGQFGTCFFEGDSVFKLCDNEIAGICGLTAEANGTQRLRAAFAGNVRESYKEMLIRSVLSSVRDSDFTVITDCSHACFKVLGFKTGAGGTLSVNTRDLNFSCNMQ